VVAERDRVDAGREHLVRELWRDSNTVGEVLAVRDAEVDAPLFPQRRQACLDRAASGNADDVSDEQDSHQKCLGAFKRWFTFSRG
jgi:hypothetical protein